MNVNNEYVDRPDVDEVMQEETGMVAIPVRIEDPVRIDQLPNELGNPHTVVLPIGETRQLCGREPRRARITLIVYNNDIVISTRPIDRPDVGAFIPAGIPLPIHLNTKDALYAYPVSADTTGTEITFGEAADSASVTVLEERWAR